MTRKRRRQRQLVEVNRLSDTDCILSTTFDTKETGSDTAAGILFALQPKQTMDLLTIEFYVSDNGNNNNANVQVFYRNGEGFIDAINQPSEWEELANTDARIIPGLRPRAIIPVKDFSSVTMESGNTHAFYVIISESSAINVKNVGESSIGSVSSNDDLVDVQTGVSVENSDSFPSSYVSASQFNGILHYQLTSQCQEMQTNTEIIIEFAVNDEPSDGITDGLMGAVETAVLDYMDENPILARFKDFYFLNLGGAKTSFQGRSQKCPAEYKVCSLFSTVLTMSHSPALHSGELRLGILGGSKAIEKSVKSKSPVDLIYAGDELSTLELLITLFNAPGDKVNPTQRRYLESVTMHLLKEVPGATIHTAIVLDEIQEDSQRQLSLPLLRGTLPRELQPSIKLQVVIQITSFGAVSDVKRAVLEILGDNDSTYHTELVTQQLGPGEINEQNFGDFFASINQLQVQVKPADFSEEQNKPANVNPSGANKDGSYTSSFSIWVVVCLVLIVMSLMTILYRIYKDCCSLSPDQKQSISKQAVPRDVDGGDSGTVDHMDLNEEVDDSDIRSISIADLSVGDQELEEDSSSAEFSHGESQKGTKHATAQLANDNEGKIDASQSAISESESDSLEEDSELSESDLNESESEASELISRADFEPGPSPESKGGKHNKESKTNTWLIENDTGEESNDKLPEDANDDDHEKDGDCKVSENSEGEDGIQDDGSSCADIHVMNYESDSSSQSTADEAAQKAEMDNESDEESSLSPLEDQGSVQSDEESSTSLSDNQSAVESSQTREESTNYGSNDDNSVDPLDIEDDNVEESHRHIPTGLIATVKNRSVQDGSNCETSEIAPATKTQNKQHSIASSQSSISEHSTGPQGLGGAKKPRNQSGLQGRGLTASRNMPDSKVTIQKNPHRKNSLSNSRHNHDTDSFRSGCVGDASSRFNANQNLGTPRNKSAGTKRGIQASRSMPVNQGAPKNQPPFNSQHSRSPGTIKNQSGTKGRGLLKSKSMPYQHGAPITKHPPTKHFPTNSQHSRGTPTRMPSGGPRNQSGLNGRGLQPSRSMPAAPKKHAPMKHRASNSQHSAGSISSIGTRSSHSGFGNASGVVNGRGMVHTKNLPSKKLTQNLPRNQSGMNGSGIAGSRTTSAGSARTAPVKKISVLSSNDEESEMSSVTAGNFPKRPASAIIGRSNLKGKVPEQKIERSHSAESILNQYGRAGKIKFQPRPKPQPTLVKMK